MAEYRFSPSLGIAVVLVLAGLALLWQIATRRTIAVSVVGAVAAAAASVVFFLQPVYEAVHEVTGLQDAGRLAGHISILFAGYAANMIFVGMVPTAAARRKRHLILLGMFLGAATILAVCVISSPATMFEALYVRGRPVVAVYLLTFLTFLGAFVAAIAIQAHRRAREVKALMPQDVSKPQARHARTYLLVGLRVLSWLGPTGAMYVGSKIVFMILSMADHPWTANEWIAGSVWGQLSVLIAVAGVTIPLFGPPIDNAGRNVWALAAFRKLGPLWHDIGATANVPKPPGFGAAQMRLQLRMAEIYDRIWRLQRWMPQGQLPKDPAQAAAAINAALDAEDRQEVPGPAAAPHTAASVSTAAETAWLLKVGQSLSRLRPSKTASPKMKEASR